MICSCGCIDRKPAMESHLNHFNGTLLLDMIIRNKDVILILSVHSLISSTFLPHAAEGKVIYDAFIVARKLYIHTYIHKERERERGCYIYIHTYRAVVINLTTPLLHPSLSPKF